ncbi:transcriptional regulator [Pseudomonas aeruginosa]|nr:transcriptional regulator [Pseudomonas aeruginosa]MEE3523067.1 transcriptional regulator [Pseudomonas aeruginosa]NBK28519.1 transcriptional regulator [Pseudomonas aeruginosa]NBY84334.1 transcriptional regulator [Pseudomonas aeruginosa]RUK29179.1 transcriptional regulator [Pseudomonas aeruginosa]WNP73919.1 transcriptional regulator [Pseudomonas aeruginosa]
MKDRPHDDAMTEQLRANPSYAAELLNEVIRHGDLAELAILLRQLGRAFGRDEGGSLTDAERNLLST